jgi:hypothetical protein
MDACCTDAVRRLALPCGRVALCDAWRRVDRRVTEMAWRTDSCEQPKLLRRLRLPLLEPRKSRCTASFSVLPAGVLVDHRDRNGLNNCRYNLRLATTSQNAHNQGARGGSSQFKGVWWKPKVSRWRASITHERKKITIGHFVNEVDAARAYDAMALRLHGEFAVLNFPALPSPSEAIR